MTDLALALSMGFLTILPEAGTPSMNLVFESNQPIAERKIVLHCALSRNPCANPEGARANHFVFGDNPYNGSSSNYWLMLEGDIRVGILMVGTGQPCSRAQPRDFQRGWKWQTVWTTGDQVFNKEVCTSASGMRPPYIDFTVNRYRYGSGRGAFYLIDMGSDSDGVATHRRPRAAFTIDTISRILAPID